MLLSSVLKLLIFVNFLLGLILLAVETIMAPFLILLGDERIQLSLGQLPPPEEFPGHISALLKSK